MSAPTVLDGLDAVRAAVGRALGTSDWTTVSAEQVALFLEATAAAAGPGGGDAPDGAGELPGLLVLSLTNLLLPRIVEVRGVSAGLNRGTGVVRFPAPAPVGSRVRASARLVDAVDVAGGVDTTMLVTVEAEGTAEPACVVESLSRWLA